MLEPMSDGYTFVGLKAESLTYQNLGHRPKKAQVRPYSGKHRFSHSKRRSASLPLALANGLLVEIAR